MVALGRADLLDEIDAAGLCGTLDEALDAARAHLGSRRRLGPIPPWRQRHVVLHHLHGEGRSRHPRGGSASR